MAEDAARAELPLGWLPILRAVVDAPQWWITRRDLGAGLDMLRRDGRPNAVLRGRLEEMLGAKWLEPWEAERREAVTLSPLAAARLGCKLTQPDDPAKEPRWVDTNSVFWPRANAERQFVAVELSVLNSVYDPQPRPDQQAMIAEAFKREVAAAVAELLRGDDSRIARLLKARPRIIIMGCELVWREQTVERGDEFKPRPYCSACRGAELREHSVCARCFRWYLDQFFAWKPAKSRERAA